MDDDLILVALLLGGGCLMFYKLGRVWASWYACRRQEQHNRYIDSREKLWEEVE